LIEDNPGDVLLVREALEEYSIRCDVSVIANGERAIDFIDSVDAGEARCPDLVILDLNLPRKPGTDVLRHMRQSPRCNHIPIVVLTSSNSQKDRDDTARLGASRYIRKPSRLDEFIRLGAVFKEMLPEETQ
jgi:CheY-like chemotaxis protein